MQEGYGLRSEVASFALPLGTALKRDGATILQGFNAIFIAQIYHSSNAILLSRWEPAPPEITPELVVVPVCRSEVR